MKAGRPGGNPSGGDAAGLLARWLLGALFVYMGLSKALHPVEFLKLVRQYDLVQSPLLLNSIAGALPWFEAFCGVLLLAGIAVRGTALVLIGMLVPFTIVVFHRALAIQSALAIPFCAVKFDCGCGTGEVFICRKLVENTLLIVLSSELLWWRQQKLDILPLFSFKGRISRHEFWLTWISLLAIPFVGADMPAATARISHLAPIILAGLWMASSIWICLAMQLRRWHDRDKSGWMVLVNFIPVVGSIWALVELGFLKGTTGPNEYGEDTLQNLQRDAAPMMSSPPPRAGEASQPGA